jgi:ligand-binding sensor domain-containing protein/signal transduction histidine kinase
VAFLKTPDQCTLRASQKAGGRAEALTLQGGRLTLRFLMLALLVAPVALAGDATEYSRRVWRSEDGLPQNKIQAITQTREGYLWVGTSGGLVRFDGVRFVVFDRSNTPALRDDSILALSPARDGSLWIGTEGGGLVHMQAGVFRNYSANEGLTNGFVRAIAQDRAGHLWVGTDRGFFRFDHDHLLRLDARNDIPIMPVKAIYEDRSGTVWVSSVGLFQMRGDVPIHMTGALGSWSDINAISEGSDGSLWLAADSGAHRLVNGVLARNPRFDALSARRILEDHEGNLWIGTFGQGLLRSRDGVVTAYRAPETLPNNAVLSIFEDRERNLWVGTQDGLLRLTQSAVRTITSKDGLADDNVATVYQDPAGSLWVGTFTGKLYRMENGRAVEYRIPAPFERFHARSIYVARDGAKWLGSNGEGILRIAAGKTQSFTRENGMRSNDIRDFLEDGAGNVWIATGSGLSRWDGNAIRTFYIEDGLAYGGTHALALDRNGDLLVGTDGGLNRVHEGRFVHDAAFASLGNERIWSIVRDRHDSLWLGTRGDGLIRIRDGKVTRYTTRDGLPGNAIYRILEDANGRLWMSGSAGIFSADAKELDAIADGRTGPVAVVPFGMDEGLLSSQMTGGLQPAGCITGSGELWFASVRGAVHIDPLQLRRTPPAPVLIESMAVDGQPVPLSGALAIPPGRGKLEIDFTSPNLLSPERVTFQYKLENFDDVWTPSGKSRAAYYTNLPPGRYSFHVMARDGANPDRISEAALAFTLQPRFYETGWFYAALATAIGLMVWMILRLYARQTKARYALVLAERTRLAREMHDTVIQGCVGVSTLLEAARSLPPASTTKARELLDRAALQVRLTVDEAREAVWDLRHSSLDHNLTDTLRDYARQVTAAEGIPVRAQIEGTPAPLDDEADRNLLLVAREAIHNAVIHGHPAEINVRLCYETTGVSLEVSDDGLGFAPEVSRENGHYGIVGMKERVEQSGGTFQLLSGVGQGTRVTARLPLRSTNGKH